MQRNHPLEGFWRLADPKISLASFAGMAMAALFAAADAGLAPGWFVLTVLGIFCIEVGKNASGELVDFDSGADQAVAAQDKSPFSGGKRVLVDGLLTRAQCSKIAAVFFAAGIVIGLLITIFRDPRVLSIGLVGIALAWYYHGGSIRLSYRGLGELAVAAAYGPGVVCGTYLVQTGYLTGAIAYASVSLGLLVSAFLWVNQFPDYLADKAAGKRNLVVRLGRERAVTVYITIVSSAYLLLVFAALSDAAAPGMLLGTAGIIPAGFAIGRLLDDPTNTPRVIPAQAASLISFLTMALGTGLGYLLF